MAAQGLIAVLLFAVAGLASASSLPSTSPAFLWSPEMFSSDGMKDHVVYETISTGDLAKSVLDEGGWSNILCTEKKNHDSVDFAVVFIGKKLHSSDISKNVQDDPTLIDMLKLSFTNSKLSIAFPYVANGDGEIAENLLMSTFAEACGDNVVETKKFYDLDSFGSFVSTKMEERSNGHTELVVFAYDVKQSEDAKSEGDELSQMVDILKQSSASYSILYTSEPSSLHHLGLPIERFLADSTNTSNTTSTCDSLCHLQSSLVEGVFVGIVLLIILISGLMCMMGISTPSKFEAPKES